MYHKHVYRSIRHTLKWGKPAITAKGAKYYFFAALHTTAKVLSHRMAVITGRLSAEKTFAKVKYEVAKDLRFDDDIML